MLESQKQPLREAARTDAQTTAAAAEHQEERGVISACWNLKLKRKLKCIKRKSRRVLSLCRLQRVVFKQRGRER